MTRRDGGAVDADDPAAGPGDDAHAIGMDAPTDAEKRAYDWRLTWGWRLVAVGIVTAPTATWLVQLDNVANHVLFLAMVAPAAVGPILNGSAIIQFADQTVGKFGPWATSGQHPEPRPVQTTGGGVFFGILWVAAGCFVAVWGLSVVL